MPPPISVILLRKHKQKISQDVNMKRKRAISGHVREIFTKTVTCIVLNDSFPRFIVEIEHKFPCHFVEVCKPSENAHWATDKFRQQLAADDVDNAAAAFLLI